MFSDYDPHLRAPMLVFIHIAVYKSIHSLNVLDLLCMKHNVCNIIINIHNFKINYAAEARTEMLTMGGIFHVIPALYGIFERQYISSKTRIAGKIILCF